MHPDFDAANLLNWLDKAAAAELEGLDFGVIGMTRDGAVRAYNRTEGLLSELTPSRVIGRNFFTALAPCTNNYLVAHRFEVEEMSASFGVAIDRGGSAGDILRRASAGLDAAKRGGHNRVVTGWPWVHEAWRFRSEP